MRDHDLGCATTQIRAVLVKTARFGFMKQVVQIKNLLKTMGLVSWNLKRISMPPTGILLVNTGF